MQKRASDENGNSKMPPGSKRLNRIIEKMWPGNAPPVLDRVEFISDIEWAGSQYEICKTVRTRNRPSKQLGPALKAAKKLQQLLSDASVRKSIAPHLSIEANPK